MKFKTVVAFVTMIYFFICNVAFSQMDSEDIKDVVRRWHKDSSAAETKELVVNKNYISMLPLVGYAPANGFLIGGVMSVSRLLGPSPTNLSSGMLNFSITTKDQFIINARSKIYTPNNKWFLQGDWRMLFFTQPTYGLGVNNSGASELMITLNNLPQNSPPQEQPMKYNYLRVYEDAVRKIGDSKFYVGGGVAFDRYFKINDEKLDTVSSSPDYFITSHFAYSDSLNFDPTKYSATGLNLDVLTDTRDNISNPYKGYYASLTFRLNPEFSKNSQASLMLLYDFRYYLALSKSCPRKVLAFWTYGIFIPNGYVPYLVLPANGWDTYNRAGRGYIQGRFRGLNMLYSEVEYRFPISKNGFLGGVCFLNNTFVQGASTGLFYKAAPGVGAGLRLKMDKVARVNLTIDYGMGLDHSSGIYFSMQEAF